MIFRVIDEDNDWTFGKGQNNYARDNGAVSLNIRTRVNSWLNDCFFAMNEGIDWYNRLGSFTQKELLDLDLKRVILNTEDVTGMNGFESSVNEQRQYVARFDISTIYSKSYTDNIVIGV